MLGLKFYNKGSASADIKENFREWVQNSPGYASDPAYCEALFEQYHDEAFEASYSMGGRRRSSKFDDDQYITQLTARMSAKAQADGKQEIADGMKALKVMYQSAPGD